MPASRGRRRTDGADGPAPEVPADLSDHPTSPGRSRADRRRDGLLDSSEDPGRRPQPGRPAVEPRASRPPLPPVRPVAIGPRTTMAPFQPAPVAEAPEPTAPSVEDLWGSRGSRPAAKGEQPPATQPPVERRSVPPRAVEPRPVPPRPLEPRAPRPMGDLSLFDVAAVPVRPAEPRPVPAPAEDRAARARDDDRAAPWSTGPTGARVLPPAALPGRASGAARGTGPVYGDWTRPSRSGVATEPSGPAAGPLAVPAPPVPPAPETAAIPERSGTPGSRFADDADDRWIDDEPADDHTDAGYAADLDAPELDDPARDDDPAGPATGEDLPSVTGTTGGRAARRAERQAAAEAAKRRSGRRGAPAPGDDAAPRRSPRRAVTGLVAVAVVALGVLGVYSYASPHTSETASKASAPSVASAPSSGTVDGLSDLPPLSAGPVSAAPPAPSTPIRLPVTVLNETDVHGLAAQISGKIKAQGWPTTGVGAYGKKDVAASTVFFTQGDENQRQAALQLIAQFPQLQGPTPRFFDVPGNASPGLVVVAAGDWKP